MTEKDALEESRMSLGEHLEELRLRLLYSLGAVAAVFFVLFVFFAEQTFNLVAAPIIQSLLSLGYDKPYLIALRPADRFLAYFKVCGVASLFFASPVVFYELWQFVAAGLYPHERRYVRILFPFSALAFVVGMAFGYLVLVRYGLQFLYGFGNSTLIHTTPTVNENVDFVIKMSLAVGVVFQLPLVMWGLERMHMVTVKQFRAARRYAIVGCAVVGMVLTPDNSGVTQLLLAVPLYALYELGILLCRWSQSPAS